MSDVKHAISYCKEHPEEINLLGIVEAARGLDVETLTVAVEIYTMSQREILKGINEKFKALGITQGKKGVKKHNVGDSKFIRDLKQMNRSRQNVHYVYLLTKHSVEDVAEEYGFSNDEVKGVVEEFEELISSLEDQVRAENDKAKESEASSNEYLQGAP